MSDLRTAQQFHQLDQARDEWARIRAVDRRRAEKLERWLEEEIVWALVSDHPDATRPAVQAVLAGKPLKDTRRHTQILNAQQAVRHLNEYAASGKDLEERLLPALHHKLMENLDAGAGQYRSRPTQPILPGYTPTAPAFIAQALKNTFGWLSTASFHEIHAIEQAALVCARLLEIQPFAAGNIKTAQLLASAPLVRQGFPPAIFRREDQPLFLRALSMAFLLSMQELIDLYVQTLQQTFERMKLVARS